MNRFRFGTLLLIAPLFLLGTATTVRAQGFISPLIGYNFGGDAGCQQLTDCEDKRLNIGVALGVLGPVFGFEEEIADAKNFFGDVPSQSSSVITVMSNFMLVPALGPVHPYVLGGVGLIKSHVEFDSGSLLSTTNNDFGWDVGGGVIVFFGGHIGIRGDIRHFHTFQDLDLPLVGTSLSGEALTFGRASGALVLRF